MKRTALFFISLLNRKRIVAAILLSFLVLTTAFLNDKIIAVAEIGTSAASMITLECSTNRVLFQKNADQRRPIASTTKIMTAITVLELCDDIEREVRIPKEAVGVEGSSIYLQYNEKLTIKDLLYGLMLQSGNDCAVALAYAISGNIPKFADEMNRLAKKIGAVNTNFVNPHGLHHDKHYSTARELGLLSSYAMKNADFREIVGTKRYSMPWEGRDYDRIIINKNKILYNYQGGNGVKTGFTKRAGRCLVSAAERNNMQVITVVLNCGPMFQECMTLMDKAFNSFVMSDIIKQNMPLCKVKIEHGKQIEINVGCIKDCYYPLTQYERDNLRFEYEIVDSLKAPVVFETEVGVVKVFLSNQLLFSEKLYTIEEAASLDVRDYLKDLIRKWNQI